MWAALSLVEGRQAVAFSDASFLTRLAATQKHTPTTLSDIHTKTHPVPAQARRAIASSTATGPTVGLSPTNRIINAVRDNSNSTNARREFDVTTRNGRVMAYTSHVDSDLTPGAVEILLSKMHYTRHPLNDLKVNTDKLKALLQDLMRLDGLDGAHRTAVSHNPFTAASARHLANTQLHSSTSGRPTSNKPRGISDMPQASLSSRWQPSPTSNAQSLDT